MILTDVAVKRDLDFRYGGCFRHVFSPRSVP
jgi:hypothetical protein